MSAPTQTPEAVIVELVGLIESIAAAETDLEVPTETADMALERVLEIIAGDPKHELLAESVRETRAALLDCLRDQGVID